jgi:hypothetical protein
MTLTCPSLSTWASFTWARSFDALQAKLTPGFVLAHPFAAEPFPLPLAILDDGSGMTLEQRTGAWQAVGEPRVRIVETTQAEDRDHRAPQRHVAIDGISGQIAHDEGDQHVERRQVADGALPHDPDHQQHERVDESGTSGDHRHGVNLPHVSRGVPTRNR